MIRAILLSTLCAIIGSQVSGLGVKAQIPTCYETHSVTVMFDFPVKYTHCGGR